MRRARGDDYDVSLGDPTGHRTLHASARPPGPRNHASASRVLTGLRIEQAATGDQCARALEDEVDFGNFAVDRAGDDILCRATMNESDADVVPASSFPRACDATAP